MEGVFIVPYTGISKCGVDLSLLVIPKSLMMRKRNHSILVDHGPGRDGHGKKSWWRHRAISKQTSLILDEELKKMSTWKRRKNNREEEMPASRKEGR